MPAPDGRAHIREARLLLGWTQDRLAEIAGLTRVTVNHLESGRPVTAETMRRVMLALRDAGGVVDEDGTLQSRDGDA